MSLKKSQWESDSTWLGLGFLIIPPVVKEMNINGYTFLFAFVIC